MAQHTGLAADGPPLREDRIKPLALSAADTPGGDQAGTHAST